MNRRTAAGLRRRTCPLWARKLAGLAARDPGRRGIAQLLQDSPLRPADELHAAASLLAGTPGEAILVTGFPVLTEHGPQPETDGPPGAVLLGATLQELGWRVTVATDPMHVGVIRAIADTVGAGGLCVFECVEGSGSPPWSLDRAGKDEPKRVLISVERPGPAYSAVPQSEGATPDPVFDEVVPPEHRGQLHGFRGNIITEYCAPLHEWFTSDEGGAVTSVGVGDGGNEIGFGRVPWRLIHTTIDGHTGGLIACCVPTDYLIVAGVSNWGAYALALSAAKLARSSSAADWVTPARDDAAVRAAVRAGAVDGVTGRPEPLVDGLPSRVHADFVAQARRITGFD